MLRSSTTICFVLFFIFRYDQQLILAFLFTFFSSLSNNGGILWAQQQTIFILKCDEPFSSL